LDSDQGTRLLENSIFELIPMKSTLEKAAALPEGTTISVTASPDKGMGATVELSVRLAELGYNVVPHLSARGIKTRAELAEIIHALEPTGIDQAFIVGGDAPDPGEFFDSIELLTALEAMDHPFRRLGVTGYPEGHPTIPDDKLMEALLAKLPHASYIATQMCFDAAAIERWINTIRAAGVDLPIKLGVPGAVDTVKLVRIGARIGVGQSLRFLKKNVKAIKNVLLGGVSTTDNLVAALGPTAGELGIEGLHIFTFNAVADTVAWWQEGRAKA
jgi:methylenetetrahydrofolate reductase (NADPH)